MAGSFSQDFIETLRNAGDIVRLVSDYVPLKTAGSRQKGLCPFHEEKTPSFSVDPSRQLFYCFGCQTGGDVFKFVMLYEKLNFPEAVEFLARRWGVQQPTVKSRKEEGPQDRLRRINEPEGPVILCQPGLVSEMIQPLLSNDAIPRNQEISVAKK